MKFLDIKVPQGRDFTGTIHTDGTILCIHFLRPKILSDESENKAKAKIKIKSTDVVGATDPGRVIIYYTVVKDTTGKVKIYKLTRKEYYTNSGILEARGKSSTWNNGIKKTLKTISQVTTKGVSFVKFKDYLQTYITEYDSLWEEYLKPRWSRQRFRLFCGKKKVFANFFNAIKNDYPNKRIIMAFGSAKFAPGSKNEVSVPTTSAFNECKFRFPTIVVDEFRTSLIHHVNDGILQKVEVRGKKYALRGLLWCPLTNKFIGRDFNAALNILRCATLPLRPRILTRTENSQRITQIVGKKIKHS
jgi:hypothetical protein